MYERVVQWTIMAGAGEHDYSEIIQIMVDVKDCSLGRNEELWLSLPDGQDDCRQLLHGTWAQCYNDSRWGGIYAV